jgi:exonuclease SbcD
MRFLHTGDWHIGKGLHGRSRRDEQEKLVSEVLDIATREKIDCLLFAGDLYDSLAPPPEAERLVYHFFGELAGRGIRSVFIGGNHDHPLRLAAVAPVLERLRITVRPQVQRPENGGVIEFEAGGVRARIALLPWVWAAKLTPAEEALGPQDKLVEKYLERASGMVQQLTATFTPDAVNIVLAHLYVANAELSPGAERTVCTTHGYAIPAQVFPPTASYIALGHLHRPQEIAAPSPLFYCGSPLQLDFGEQGQAKRVVVIDGLPGRKAKIDSVPITCGRQLSDVRATIAELEKQAEELQGDLLRVTVRLPKPQLGVADRVREFLPGAVQVTVELPEAARPAPGQPHERLDPRELFARFYRDTNNADAPDALLQAFAELHEEASRASR